MERDALGHHTTQIDINPYGQHDAKCVERDAQGNHTTQLVIK